MKKIAICVNELKHHDIVFTTNSRRFLSQRDRERKFQ